MRTAHVLAIAASVATCIAACGSKSGNSFPSYDFGDSGSGAVGDGASMALPLGSGSGYTGPSTCEQAVTTRSYIGCDYWPTVTTNPVWSIFDFTVVVANTQASAASVHVTGPGGTSQTVTVPAGSLSKIYLPWVPALKGPDCDSCGAVPAFTKSVTAPASAYHLVSSLPVTVYQFNALEYKGSGGAPGKDWSACPGSAELCTPTAAEGGGKPYYAGCYSYTNDASLLIPSTAMTGNYRVTGEHATAMVQGGYFAITAVKDDTHVVVTVASTATVVAGGTVPATPAGGTVNLTMSSGDVVEIMSDDLSDSTDLSGSLVQADQPVQVIAGIQCADQPIGYPACDHLESSVLPAETLGKDYVVTVPTSPGGVEVGHVVRFFGNVDGTTLTYSPTRPSGCPATLDAGQAVECSSIVKQTFEVTGTNAFAVSSFQLGGSIVDPSAVPGAQEGDPSMSPMVATEQYLSDYIFLAPTDYDESFVDIVAAPGTSLKLDGTPISVAKAFPTPVNSSWSVTRIELNGGGSGAHILTGSSPFGVQVMGYGAYTSYQYPAGLDLAEIAPPPPNK